MVTCKIKNKLIVLLLVCLQLVIFSACSKNIEPEPETEEESQKKLITVGFSQLGAESDWRNANSRSMREALTEENGYKLLFEDGQQKQSNQIMAIRTFIQQEVDYIVLAPVTKTGWDTVLQEAKDAGIPVIVVDRMVSVSDESLFTCFVGSDPLLESKKVTAWLNAYLESRGIDSSSINIVDIQGNIGATAQFYRTVGLSNAVWEYKWNLLGASPGDFTQAKGKEVMDSFLKKYDDINVVYCENDNMALGAIEAIEEAGKKTGSDIKNGDIMIISFDAVNEQALNYVLDDKISCIAECNPLHGPRVSNIIKLLEQGKSPAKVQYVDEGVYAHDDTVRKINVDKKEYEIIEMTDDIIYNKRLEFGN